jgi:L-2-hydroxyglutarate oxidase
MANQYDIAIIGGGVIGMATAMALVNETRAKVVVLEAEDHLAAHQTGHNSGVIHSGIYYKPGSLKAQNCIDGRLAMYRFCEEHGIAHDNCGKLIVATSEKELPALDRLEERGKANGLEGLQRLNSLEALREFEPHVYGIAGLHVKQTGIVDYLQVTNTYGQIVREKGGEVRLNSRVTKVNRMGDESVLETLSGEVHARNLINCAGLQSDRVAKMCGVDPKVQILPFRGEYAGLRPPADGLVRELVYPVPDPDLPFLGVHATRGVDGQVHVGPNAVLALAREGYDWRTVRARELAGALAYPGLARMARRWWRYGLGEVRGSLSREAMAARVRRMLPDVRAEHLRPAGAGVRAQAVRRDGTLVDDFLFVREGPVLHVLNAPSPAATSALPIGRAIAAQLTGQRLDPVVSV